MQEIKTLPNGVRLICEHVPGVRSAAVGVWVGAGSRCETAAEGGYAHFIEHMLFKGTDRHSARSLAAAMDDIGGQIDAYTTRDTTCFYARVLDTHLDAAAELLAEMFFRSRFDEADVASERSVIFEEIDMYADTPEDLVAERLFASSFPGALGRPILGTKTTLSRAGGDALRKFMKKHYVPSRVAVALCGSFTDEQAGRILGLFEQLEPAAAPKMRPAAYVPGFSLRRRATEQNHLCLGFPGLPAGDGRRFALTLMSTILGGGASSRLFQSVREKHGLCYSVGSFTSSHSDCGLVGIDTAVAPESEMKALGLILEEVRRLCECGVTEAERSRALEQLRSGLLLAEESTSSRMNRMGSSLVTLGSCLTAGEVIERCEAVTAGDIAALAGELLAPEGLSLSAVGRVKSADEYREVIAKNA